jgi:hypothetical protein
MNNIDFYLTHAHSARRRIMYMSVATGAFIGGVAQFLEVPFNHAVIACVAATGLVEIIGAFRYVEPDRKGQRAVAVLPVRRDLIRAAFSAAAMLLLSLLRIPHMGELVFERKLQQASGDPTSPRNIQDVKLVLAQATAAQVPISSDVVRTAGIKFLEAAQNQPVAWDAARAFLDYRSLLNAGIAPRPTPATGKSKYRESVTIKPNPDHPERHPAFQVTFAGGYATPDKSARLETMRDPQPMGSEFAFFTIDGYVDTIVLDGMYMKHVVIRNADVQYDGGPIRLEDVYFVNCVFHSRFTLTLRGIDLSREILRAAGTTFPSNQITSAS